MNKTLTTSVIAIALAGGGAVGLGSLAAASYGDEPPTLDTDTGATDATEESDDTAEPTALQQVTDTTDDPGAAGRGERKAEVAADALGITTDELREARQAGQSLADVAAAQGVPVDDVVQALVADAEARIADRVAGGDLTQEEADERLAGIDERIAEKVDAAPGEGRGGIRGLRDGAAVSEALGVTADELREARQAGQSLADVAAAQGVPVDDVVTAIVDGIEAHLAEEVAEGELTEEQAAERLASAEERVTERVDAEPGERGPRGARRGPAPAADV